MSNLFLRSITDYVRRSGIVGVNPALRAHRISCMVCQAKAAGCRWSTIAVMNRAIVDQAFLDSHRLALQDASRKRRARAGEWASGETVEGYTRRIARVFRTLKEHGPTARHGRMNT